MIEKIKEKIIKIGQFLLASICGLILGIAYFTYIIILFGIVIVLIPAGIVMSPFIFAENYFKKKDDDKKQKERDQLWQKFKNGEIDEDEYNHEIEFLN